MPFELPFFFVNPSMKLFLMNSAKLYIYALVKIEVIKLHDNYVRQLIISSNLSVRKFIIFLK